MPHWLSVGGERTTVFVEPSAAPVRDRDSIWLT